MYQKPTNKLAMLLHTESMFIRVINAATNNPALVARCRAAALDLRHEINKIGAR